MAVAHHAALVRGRVSLEGDVLVRVLTFFDAPGLAPLRRLARAWAAPGAAGPVALAMSLHPWGPEALLQGKDRVTGPRTLYWRGRAKCPFEAYLVFAPCGGPARTYLALDARGHNYSFFPTSPGTAVGDAPLKTTFAKLRVDPWTLRAKTDDFAFAESVGGPVVQRYWNGRAELTLARVAYATARACTFERRNVDAMGKARCDLEGTPFVLRDRFELMGCVEGYRGAIRWRRGSVGDGGGGGGGGGGGDALNPGEGALHWVHPGGAVFVFGAKRLTLVGGGGAGRLCPVADRTPEAPTPPNYADEGRNGGWVLQLGYDCPVLKGDALRAALRAVCAAWAGGAGGPDVGFALLECERTTGARPNLRDAGTALAEEWADEAERRERQQGGDG